MAYQLRGVTEYYLISSSSANVTTATSGWQTSMVKPTEAKPYLWNYEKILYSNNTNTVTTPIIIGNFAKDGVNGTNGTNGTNGRGISAVTEYYYAATVKTRNQQHQQQFQHSIA